MQNQFYYPQPILDPVLAERKRKAFSQKKEKKELIVTGCVIGATIIAYIIVQILVLTAITLFGLYDLMLSSSVFQNCVNIIAVHICSMLIPFTIMARILKNRYVGPLIPTKKLKPLSMASWVGFGVFTCIGANILVNTIVSLFYDAGIELTQGEFAKPDNVFALFVIVFSTSIVPAIIEEYAMRCCTMGALRKYGKGFAVFAVSIVFGLIHMNVIQFIFAFTIGLILAYITVVTDNVIPAMLIHGINNGFSVVNDIAAYFGGEDIASTVLFIIYIICIVLGLAGTIYLFAKKQLITPKSQREPKNPYALSFGVKLLCLIPGFFVPFVILILFTLTTINPV